MYCSACSDDERHSAIESSVGDSVRKEREREKGSEWCVRMRDVQTRMHRNPKLRRQKEDKRGALDLMDSLINQFNKHFRTVSNFTAEILAHDQPGLQHVPFDPVK